MRLVVVCCVLLLWLFWILLVWVVLFGFEVGFVAWCLGCFVGCVIFCISFWLI